MDIRFFPSADTVAVFDIFEVLIRTGTPVEHPFETVSITATFAPIDAPPITVRGFCDQLDGSVYRVRFMPTQAGAYTFSLIFRFENQETGYTGSFTAQDIGKRGVLQVDPAYPFHFQWSGTGEHFFWNATTAYLLAGVAEPQMQEAIDRLHWLGVNRLRVGLCPSRQINGGRWFEPQVQTNETFTFLFSPWLTAQPDSQADPRPDVRRFNVLHWQKYERLLRVARDRDMIVQVIFFIDAQEPQNYPFDRTREGDDPDERRYYDYAIARLAAFSNVEWCVTNEWRLFRPDAWAETIGGYLAEQDPYHHLISVHGHGDFPFAASPWASMALFQIWDEHGGFATMLQKRREQKATGSFKPQINEEYGYEDHYPQGWGEARQAPTRSAETRIRLAWEITMAGCYQTTGESATNGLGGWINGRGDDSMRLFVYHRHLVHFFTAFAWWKLEPRPDLAGGAMCLAEPGVRYVVYLPAGQDRPSLQIAGDGYRERWYDPMNGLFSDTPRSGDRVLLLERS